MSDARWPEELLQHRKAGIHTVRGMEVAQVQALVGDEDLLATAPLLCGDLDEAPSGHEGDWMGGMPSSRSLLQAGGGASEAYLNQGSVTTTPRSPGTR